MHILCLLIRCYALFLMGMVLDCVVTKKHMGTLSSTSTITISLLCQKP